MGLRVPKMDRGECPSNEKKFLRLFTYEGEHEFEVKSMSYSDAMYSVLTRCIHCDSYDWRYYSREIRLIELGIPREKIDEAESNRHSFVDFDDDSK